MNRHLSAFDVVFYITDAVTDHTDHVSTSNELSAGLPIGGENPEDIKADIKVADTSVYHRHVVKSGETLGKIANLSV